MTQRRPDRSLLLGMVVVGYLLVWSAFGLLMHLLDAALHALVVAVPWLTFNGWFVGAGVLALAGLFQFSALKYHCLDKCRTPFSFINQHWHGAAPIREAFRLGLHHGLFCVGCCWSIMALMFVVGTGSVGWMLLIGAVMAIEKNVAWGRRLSGVLGVGLLAWSCAIVVAHV
jgi:predicted metal-binding membrane protein